MTAKEKQAAQLTTVCILALGTVLFGVWFSRLFSPPELGLSAHAEAPVLTFEDLLDAIEWVESKGDATAIGDFGAAVGSFQIHKIFVDDVNRIMRLNHTDKYSDGPVQYDYMDRQRRASSRWMVRTYLKYYGGTFEEMARKVNGGPTGHKKESTKEYWLTVKARMDEQLKVKVVNDNPRNATTD